MKRTFRSIVTLVLVLSLLLGVFSSTVALAAGSLKDGTGTPDGSFDGSWLDVQYDDDELCIVIDADVKSLLDTNKEELKEIISTIIDAVRVIAIEDVKEEFLNNKFGDSNSDVSGVNIDTLWQIALDNFIRKNDYNAIDDGHGGYVNLYDASLEDIGVVEDAAAFL